MKKLAFLFPALVLFSVTTSAQVKVNRPAPHLDLQAILQGGNNAAIDKLPSTFVVLEFWATWCTPCVRNIPHINELQQKFEGENVQFISISDEPKETIELFLKKRKMNGWAGIDNKGNTFKNYHITGRPATFIIDDKGMVVFQGDPSKVTEELLTNILAGNATGPVKEDEQAKNKLGGFGGGEDPAITANFNMSKMGYLHQEVIRPTVNANLGYCWKNDNGQVGISIIGANISHAVAYLTELTSYHRIINRSSVPDTASWDFIFSRSKGYDMDKGRKELVDLICKTFSVAIKDTDVMQEAFVPVFQSAKKLIYKKDVKEDDPQLKTYQAVSDIFNAVETKTGKIVYYSADADIMIMYLDVFDLGTRYYRMSGDELIAWLQQQGISLQTENKQMKLKVLYSID